MPSGACFPSCQTGFSCVSGACVPSTCTPPCGPSQVCDPATATDAAGLANTPWPKHQRDTRNSGNADAATKWGVRTAPATCVQ